MPTVATLVKTGIALARLAQDLARVYRMIEALRKGKNDPVKRDLADTLEAEARTLTAAYKRVQRGRTRARSKSRNRERDSMGRYT